MNQLHQYRRDRFYWLAQMNKASLVINTERGLMDEDLARRIARALKKVIDDAAQPDADRPIIVIKFEPKLIAAGGIEVTKLHVGRSSQDMHGTYWAATLRDGLLDLSEVLATVRESLIALAARNRDAYVTNYTNGVPAQPNSYAHYLLGFAEAFARDGQRIRECYARIDRCPMGTTVLNGTCWPLAREPMAEYLGFGALAENAFGAVQISSVENPIDVAHCVTEIALHMGMFIQDVIAQYGQPNPWILLQEGGDNTYVSSAMPQKKNPGLLNSTRRDASTAINLAMGTMMRTHNTPTGMTDGRSLDDNATMVEICVKTLRNFNKIINALVINKERALDELNSDWTASQEVADRLMKNYGLPFRVGHHFASNMVSFGKRQGLTPLTFPYEEACRIYAETTAAEGGDTTFPMSEEEFRSTLDPIAIVENRQTRGGPQASEVERLLKEESDKLLCDKKWTEGKLQKIEEALAKLDGDFGKFL